MRRRLVATLLLTLVDPTATPWWLPRPGLPPPAVRSGYVARVETTVLPVVRELQVEYFADDEACAALAYRRGNFGENRSPRCQGPQNGLRPFDATARADYKKMQAALAASGAPIERLGGWFGGDRQGEELWFSSSQGAPPESTWSLIYDASDRLAANPFGIVTTTAIDHRAGWWFACCASTKRGAP